MEKSLFWHQGLFLQPQHFQLKDLHDQARFTPYHQYVFPEMRGVVACRFSEASLSNYAFRIEEGAFWFDDMTFAALGKNAVIEGRRFKELWLEGGKPLMVYVGLRKQNPYGENVTVVRAGESLADICTRYVSYAEADQVNDMHQKGAPAPVKTLNLMLKIFFHTEIDQLEEYELIPVAQIVRQSDEVVCSREYIPPCVSIYSSPVLSGLVREIGDHLTFKGYELEQHKKSRGIQNAGFGARDMVYLLALRSFNRYIPMIAQMLEGQHVHPREVYLVLRQLIGELSSFSDQVDVFGRSEESGNQLCKYDHEQLWGCFSRAALLISKLLDEITAGPEHVMAFEFEDPYFSTPVEAGQLEGHNHYYLVVKTRDDVDEVLESMDIGMKVAARDDLAGLIDRSLPGAGFEYQPVPPQELPRRDGALYCQLDTASEHWHSMQRDKNISVYWDCPPDDVEFELMVTRRS